MKKFLNLIFLLSVLLVFDSCINGDDDGFDITLPPNTEFSPCQDDDDGNDIDVAIEDLPQAIIDYVNENFPGLNITEADLELFNDTSYYEIHLGDDIELYFTEDGAFLCQDDSGNDDDDDDDDGNDDDDDDGNDDDDDDGDDDDDVNPNDLPDQVLAFINENYSGYNIEDVEREDLCDGTIAYEVELEDGPGEDVDLFFTLQGEFLYAATDISASELPDAVLAAINDDFPGYQIEDDDIEQFELADGSFQYEVELEADEDEDDDDDDRDDSEVIFDAEGNIVCEDD